jgi:putative endonuclease
MPFDCPSAAQQRGLTNYHAGVAAETAVELTYTVSGAVLLERRWRGAAGEIDLILRDGDELVFVEVKKSACFAQAAESLSARQLARISLAAEEYLGTQALGSLQPMRIDVALTNSRGEIDILANVTGF